MDHRHTRHVANFKLQYAWFGRSQDWLHHKCSPFCASVARQVTSLPKHCKALIVSDQSFDRTTKDDFTMCK